MGTPITRSFQHFPDATEPQPDNRLSLSMTELNNSSEMINGIKKSIKDYATSLRGKFTEVPDRRSRHDYEEDTWKTSRSRSRENDLDNDDNYDTDGYYSSKRHSRTVSHDSRLNDRWDGQHGSRSGSRSRLNEPRGMHDRSRHGLSDRLDSCGCSHTDLRCGHLDLHKSSSSKSPNRSPSYERPKQENIVGGLPNRDAYEQYGSRSRLDTQRERLESKDNHRSTERQHQSQDRREKSPPRYYDNRPPIPSEKDYQELRTEIRRIFSESRLDGPAPDYDHPSARYRSEDTLYKDVKQRGGEHSMRSANTAVSESRDNMDAHYHRSSDTRTKNLSLDTFNSRDYGVSNERSYTASRSRDYYVPDTRDRRRDDSSNDRHSTKPQPLLKTGNTRGYSGQRQETESKTASVAGSVSDCDFLVLGSGDIVKQKSPQLSRKNPIELDEARWTEPKRRFAPPPKDSSWSGDAYWKEPKRTADDGVPKKVGVVSDTWSYEDSEPGSRHGDKGTGASGWFRLVRLS